MFFSAFFSYSFFRLNRQTYRRMTAWRCAWSGQFHDDWIRNIFNILPSDFNETHIAYLIKTWLICSFFLFSYCLCVNGNEIDFVSAFVRITRREQQRKSRKKWLNFILVGLMKFAQLHWKSIAWFCFIVYPEENSVCFVLSTQSFSFKNVAV